METEMSSNFEKYYLESKNIIIPPYKGWGVVKQGSWNNYFHFTGHPDCNGVTYYRTDMGRHKCNICGICMPEEVLIYLKKVIRFVNS